MIKSFLSVDSFVLFNCLWFCNHHVYLLQIMKSQKCITMWMSCTWLRNRLVLENSVASWPLVISNYTSSPWRSIYWNKCLWGANLACFWEQIPPGRLKINLWVVLQIIYIIFLLWLQLRIPKTILSCCFRFPFDSLFYKKNSC